MNNKHRSKKIPVMIGTGEDAIFIRVQKGRRVLINSLDDSCFIRAGTSPEEARERIEDRLDNMVYGKPVAKVRKMVKKFKSSSTIKK